MENELISIIIPVKNGSNYLAEALDGIRRQNMNTEIIVVDDASTDNTADIAAQYGCVVLKHPTCQGQVVAKNTGLKSATGKYIMFHDHDDVMREGALKQLYDALASAPDTAVVMGKVKDFVSPDCKNNTAAPKPEAFWGLFTGAVLIRREVFDTIGLFSEGINTGEIIEFEGQLNQNHLKLEKLDIITTDRRIHDSNYGKTNRQKEFADYAAILRARLAKKQ